MDEASTTGTSSARGRRYMGMSMNNIKVLVLTFSSSLSIDTSFIIKKKATSSGVKAGTLSASKLGLHQFIIGELLNYMYCLCSWERSSLIT
jgi:hypothetical protein